MFDERKLAFRNSIAPLLNTKQASHAMDPSIDGRWKIGEGFMHLDNIFLAKLVHVSKGSFQAELWAMDRTT